MKEIKFDVMIGDRYQCTLKYRFSPLFPLDVEELKRYAIEQRPALRHTDFTIAL